MYGNIFEGLVTAMIALGIAIGFVLFIVVPWLWQFVKPWIHMLTA